MRLDQLLCAESLRDLFLEGSEYLAYLWKNGNAWHIETMDGRHTENFLDHEAPGFFKNIDLRTRYAPDPKALVQAFAHKKADSIIVRVDQEKLEPYLSEKDRTAFAGEALGRTKEPVYDPSRTKVIGYVSRGASKQAEKLAGGSVQYTDGPAGYGWMLSMDERKERGITTPVTPFVPKWMRG